MKLVLATHNRDKIREIRSILAGLDIELLTPDYFPGMPETVEDADTLAGNALKKAREVREFTGMSALADDTGLEVDALGGAPGVRAARFAREGATYQENCDKLLREMKDVPGPERGARFRTVMALALIESDSARLGTVDALTAEGMFPGSITEVRRGAGGFGYDPLFLDADTGRTLAEMTAEEKNERSHRYRALVEMRELMLRHGLARVTS